MSKKVSFAPKPAKTPDQWVIGKNKGKATNEAMKRFTIDVPVSLHSRIKIACAKRGTKMSDEIRVLLEKHFTEY